MFALVSCPTESGATSGNITINSYESFKASNITLTGNDTIMGTLDVTGDTSVSTFDSTGATSIATNSGAVNIASSGALTK